MMERALQSIWGGSSFTFLHARPPDPFIPLNIKDSIQCKHQEPDFQQCWAPIVFSRWHGCSLKISLPMISILQKYLTATSFPPIPFHSQANKTPYPTPCPLWKDHFCPSVPCSPFTWHLAGRALHLEQVGWELSHQLWLSACGCQDLGKLPWILLTVNGGWVSRVNGA